MRVSLVINTYNRLNTLKNTLRSIEYLRYPSLEVIVVDGPSTDGTYEYLLSHWGGKIKVVKCDERNLSKSRNVGINNSSGDIVCFTDDDAVVEPDWLDQIVKEYSDNDVGAVGGWVINNTGVDFQTKYIVSSRESSSEVLLSDPKNVPESEPYKEKFPGLIGVNSSFRRDVLTKVGGFDEEYCYFLDETDLIVRIIDAGYKVKISPNALVHHKYAPSYVRRTDGTIRSWYQIIKSISYFIIQNSLPNTKFSSCIELISKYKKDLIKNTNEYYLKGLVDQTKRDLLLDEIEKGFETGIEDAFEYLNRKLMVLSSKTEWKEFSCLMNYSKRLRLAFVTALYPPRKCGGVAVFINNLAKQLAKLGHEITVITQAEPGESHTVDFEDGVWVHRLPDSDDMKCEYPVGMPDMPPNQKRVAGIILSELNRVNHTRQFQYVIGTIWDLDLAAVIASKNYNVAMYLVTTYKLMEDSKPEWKNNNDFYNQHVRKMIDAERWAIENANLVFASTHAILNDVESAYNIKVPRSSLRILPFGVPDLANVSRYSKLNNDYVEILFVGRLEKRKGIDVLLKVIPKILENNKSVRFSLIGDDTLSSEYGVPYKEVFMKEYGKCEWIDRVVFHGHVSDQELEEAYANCDIFVAPSRYESFGLIYLEAMRFGKACIGCKSGGIPEVVLDHDTGVLASPGDDISLYDAIGTECR